jgi:starch-binding outer membrane protein, SusD/RagB family
MKHKITVFFLLTVQLTCTLSCKKFVTLEPPPNTITGELVFTGDAKAASAVNGIYGSMINGAPGFSNSLVTVYAGLASDELLRFNPSDVQQEFMYNKLSPANAQVKNIWVTAYKHIHYANAAITGLQQSASVSASVKQQLTAECRFLRVLCYFYLTGLYGDVPLVISPGYSASAAMTRTAAKEVMEFMIAELESVKQDLPLPSVADKKIKTTKWAASALLARLYLYNNDWAKAEAESSAIISSGLYTPLADVQSVFLSASKSAIFHLVPATGLLKETQEMRPFIGMPQTFITPYLINAFESGDTRRIKWVDSIIYQGKVYHYPVKYRNTAAAASEYYVVLRIEEQYLIRAEARARLGNTNDALADVNIIRQRAGLPLLTGPYTQGQLLSAVEQERKIELLAEWGHRWLDLKRTGKIDAVLTPVKPDWKSSSALFPVPEEELTANPYLTQNPGY